MTSDQIYLERETSGEKKQRWRSSGNADHLTFMPIKQTELNWREWEGREEEGERRHKKRDGWEQRARTERGGKIGQAARRHATLQHMKRQRGRVLYWNKTKTKLKPKFNIYLTDIAKEAGKDVRAYHSLRENHEKTTEWISTKLGWRVDAENRPH